MLLYKSTRIKCHQNKLYGFVAKIRDPTTFAFEILINKRTHHTHTQQAHCTASHDCDKMKNNKI